MDNYSIEDEAKNIVKPIRIPDAYDYIFGKLEIAYMQGQLQKVREEKESLKHITGEQ